MHLSIPCCEKYCTKPVQTSEKWLFVQFASLSSASFREFCTRRSFFTFFALVSQGCHFLPNLEKSGNLVMLEKSGNLVKIFWYRILSFFAEEKFFSLRIEALHQYTSKSYKMWLEKLEKSVLKTWENQGKWFGRRNGNPQLDEKSI